MKNDKVGIYLRLSSSEDGNKESESISNQRKIIMKYLNDNNLIFIKEYIDDGYSGTSFDRPGFKDLLRDINNKKINTVITKDLSRLGRNYVTVGEYIENYFPEHKIRYISIIDNIDTFEDDSQNDIAPFRSVMNEMYAKDISNKVKSSKRNMMQKGKWASGSVVYGYNLDVKNNVLIIDDEAAEIVRRIYNMFLDGKRIVDIKRILDAEGILPPGKYKKMKKITDAYEYWNTDRIKCILTNRVYKGDMVQHKTANISYKSKKKIYIPKEKQVIMENTHEPIIDKETFEKVQKKFTRKSDNKRKYQHLLKDYIYCEHCGRKLSIAVAKRKTTVDSYKVVCPLYEKDHNLCYKRYIDYRELEECILKNIKDTLEKYLDKNIINEKFDILIKEYDNELKEREILLCNYEQQIKGIENKLSILYKDRLDGIISADKYKMISESLKQEMNKFNNKVNIIKEEIIIINNSRKQDVNDYKNSNKIIAEFFDLKSPNSVILDNLIHKIKIDKNGVVTIFYKFKVMDFLCNKNT